MSGGGARAGLVAGGLRRRESGGGVVTLALVALTSCAQGRVMLVALAGHARGHAVSVGCSWRRREGGREWAPTTTREGRGVGTCGGGGRVKKGTKREK